MSFDGWKVTQHRLGHRPPQPALAINCIPVEIFAFAIDFLALQRLRRACIAFLYDAKSLGRCRPLLLIEIISGLQEYLSGFAQIVRS